MTRTLEIGAPAPAFDLPVHDPNQPNQPTRLKLGDFSGRFLVLYFYPRDNTPGCTTQAIGFTEQLETFERANTAILGVSADSLASHEKFIEKKHLKIPLGADESLQVCKAYNVWVEKKMYGKSFMGIQRSTFLISPDGKILHIWNKVKVKDHIDQILLELAKVQGSD